MLEKLLGLATVGSTFASISLLHRFLSKLAVVIVLLIVTAFMVAGLLLGSFYGLYCWLVYYGLSSTAALISVAALGVTLTIVLIGITVCKVRELRNLPPRAARQTFPGVAQLGAIAEAFVEGLTDSHHGDKKRD